MVKAPRQASASEPLTPDRLVDAALAVVDAKGWRGTSLGAVAAHLGVPVARVGALAPTRSELLRLVFRTVDQRMLAGVMAADEMENHRDRLFDLVMRRLDVLAPYRRAVESLMRDAVFDPAVGLTVLAELRRSHGLTLEAAGISTRGLWGEMRVQGFGLVYASVLRTWRDDATPDLAPTMKALDRALKQAERAEHFACSLVPRSGRRNARDRDGTEKTVGDETPGGSSPGGEPT
ncbi:MAG: hypothetical protein WCZ23_01695 [Rhodospirillaceae bacterium]